MGALFGILSTLSWLAYCVAIICFAGDAIEYYFDVSSFWGEILCWAIIFISCMIIPFASVVCIGFLFYYLAFIDDWNIFAAIVFCVPGVLFSAIAVIAGTAGAILDKIRHR